MPNSQTNQIKQMLYKLNEKGSLKTIIVDLHNDLVDLYQKPF